MSQKRDRFLRMHFDAKDMGLDLSAGRGSVPENSLWEAENLYRNSEGVIAKRPPFVQWATQIAEPSAISVADDEVIDLMLNVPSDWTQTTNTGANTYINWSNTTILMSGWQNDDLDTSQKIWRRAVKSTESFSTLAPVTLSFIIRATGLPLTKYHEIRFATKLNEQRSFYFDSSGMNIETSSGVYTALDNTDTIVDGLIHRVEINIDTDDTFTLDVDGTDVAHGAGKWSYVENTDDYFMEIQADADDSLTKTSYAITLSAIFLRDQYEAMSSASISAIGSMQTTKNSGALTYRLLAAGERYIWADFNNLEIWMPILEKAYAKTFITKFRDSLIFINYEPNLVRSEVIQYKADGTWRILTDAPNAKFGTEFADRLWLGGDHNNSKRVYFSGDRDPTLWVYPESEENLDYADMINAGYFDMVGGGREKITMMNGKFYNMMLIGSENSLWGISGSSPLDFSRRVISGDVGAAGSQSGENIINDFLCLNSNGVSSVSATEKYGDIAAARQTYFVNELFDVQNVGERTLGQRELKNSVLTDFSPKSLLFMFVSSVDSDTPDKIYVANRPEMKWFGPWDEDISCAATVTLAVPTSEHLAIGTSDGYVKYLAFMRPNTDTFKLSSPVLDGRSIDPSIQMQEKTWKHLRFYINPTGNWTFTVKWKADDGAWKTNATKILARSTDVFLGDVDTCVTGKVMAGDRHERYMIEIPLDVRGTSLKWEATGTVPKFSLLGVELDLHVAGYEKE